MRRLRRLLVLLAILVGLGAYIYFYESKREPASEEGQKKAKVFASLDAGKIAEITVRGSAGDATSLRKEGDRWTLVAPFASDADEAEVAGITSNLASLDVQRVVDEKPKDLQAFGLAAPRVEVAFKAEGDKAPRRLLIGDKTATGGDLYARLADAPRVFLISGFLDTTFDRKTFDLRDKSMLKFERDKLDAVEVRSEKQTVRFAKADEAWRMLEPLAVRADYGTVEGVIGRLSTGQMKSIAADEVTDLGTYGLDKPAVTVTLGAGSARTGLLVGKKTDDGSYYAKDAARPMVFTVESSLVDDLGKAPGDYRPKDLFEFRSFTGTRFEIARDGSTVVFEKRKGKDANAPETWAQTQPAKAVEEGKILDLLSKASNLRADSFVEKLPDGVTQVAVIATRFGDGKKTERVVFHKAGEDIYATRADEPGAMKLFAAEWTDTLKLLDAVK